MQRGHAVANGLPRQPATVTASSPRRTPVAACSSGGSSFVAGPQGEFLAQAGSHARELLLADVDLARSEAVAHLAVLRDRRIDAYGDLLRRYRD